MWWKNLADFLLTILLHCNLISFDVAWLQLRVGWVWVCACGVFVLKVDEFSDIHRETAISLPHFVNDSMLLDLLCYQNNSLHYTHFKLKADSSRKTRFWCDMKEQRCENVAKYASHAFISPLFRQFFFLSLFFVLLVLWAAKI